MTKTNRTARVELTWSAEGYGSIDLEIPDDILPDAVEEWISDEISEYSRYEKFRDWDYVNCEIDSSKIEGEYVPLEDTEEYELYLERKRLQPIPGQISLYE